jgi:hypothetical protein
MVFESSKYDEYVIKNILANNKFGITGINNLESLKSRYFIADEYPEIENLIVKHNIKEIKLLSDNQSEELEYLDILKFTDQNENSYIVTVYDSNVLEQDPQIIKIYTL